MKCLIAPATAPLTDLLNSTLGAEALWLIARGAVWLNGARVCDPAALAHAGARVEVRQPPDGIYREPVITADMILYEDQDLIALNKPAGEYVEATPWDAQGHLRAALGRFLTQRDGIPPYLHLAHRLDRDTSGVLLLSKTNEVNGALQQSFTQGQAHKTYLALCSGDPAFDETEIETGHGRGPGGMFRVFPPEMIGQERPLGGSVKAMQTRFAVIHRLGDAALLRAFPLTGRTHQIRLHLAYLGHPLIGDLKYGGPGIWRDEAPKHHHLHAARLELPHPRSSAAFSIEAPAPEWVMV